MSRYKTYASVLLLLFILSTIPLVRAASCSSLPQRSFLAGALSKILAAGGVCTSQTTVTEQGSYWIHPDYQGSMNAETDSAGNAVFSVAYRPYGSQLALSSSSTLTESLGYTGQREDPSTGLLYLHARYYDPILGRFISPDPVIPGKEIVHLNRYAYADNNPVNKTDVSGMGGEGEEKRNFTFTSSKIYRSIIEKYDEDQTHLFEKPKTFFQMLGITSPDTGYAETSFHYEIDLNSRELSDFKVKIDFLDDKDRGNSLKPIRREELENIIPKMEEIPVSKLTLSTHGYPDGMEYLVGGDTTGVAQLADVINKNITNRDPNFCIYLSSCNVGLGPIPQALADLTNVPVKAPLGYADTRGEGYVRVKYDGYSYPGAADRDSVFYPQKK